jgi:hypothetical protein
MKANIGKYKKKGDRRIDVQIERHDTYSLDRTLALIILPALIQLRDTQSGIPSEFATIGGEDYSDQQCFDFYQESHKELFESVAVARWNDTLDKMIWSFQQLVLDDYSEKYHHGTPKYDWKKTGDQTYNPSTKKMEDLYEMIDANPTEHWYDVDGHRLHEERIQEGLELFGKYYRHLWD